MDSVNKLINALNHTYQLPSANKDLILSNKVKREVSEKKETNSSLAEEFIEKQRQEEEKQFKLKEKYRKTQTQIETHCEKCNKFESCDSYQTQKNKWLCISCRKFELVMLENKATIIMTEKAFRLQTNSLIEILDEKDFITKILISKNLINLENINQELLDKINGLTVPSFQLGNVRNASLWINLIEESKLLIEIFTLEKEVYHLFFDVDNTNNKIRIPILKKKEKIEVSIPLKN